MKHLFFLFLILFSSCDSVAERVPKVRESKEREYRGKVKRLIEYDCKQYPLTKELSEIKKSDCSVRAINDYNRDETLIKLRTYYPGSYPSNPTYIVNVKVNESGLVVEREEIQEGFDNFYIKKLYSYNQDGFETESITYRDFILDYRTEKVYDEYNCLIVSFPQIRTV